MKRLLLLAALIALGLSVLGPARASAARHTEACSLDPTIQSLYECVQHAVEMGIIDDGTVAQSLFAKLDAAEAALANGNTEAAIGILQAFIYEVRAQSGVHIEATHAAHMIMHAQAVIAALQG